MFNTVMNFTVQILHGKTRTHDTGIMINYGSQGMQVLYHLIQFVSEDFSFHFIQVGLRYSVLEKLSYDTTTTVYSELFITFLSSRNSTWMIKIKTCVVSQNLDLLRAGHTNFYNSFLMQ